MVYRESGNRTRKTQAAESKSQVKVGRDADLRSNAATASALDRQRIGNDPTGADVADPVESARKDPKGCDPQGDGDDPTCPFHGGRVRLNP